MFTLDNNAPLPLYKQLYNQVRTQILSGQLPAHAKLPSVRDLAAELSTSRNTVEGAYQDLHAEGYIYSRERSGYFVSQLDRDAAPRKAPEKPLGRVRQPEPPPEYRYDFHPARLDPGSFPTALWRKCFLHCLPESAAELSQYGDPQGDWGLRRKIRDYLERSRGVVCEPDQIVICTGLQQGLDIVAHLLRGSGARLAVENPGYHLPRAVFRNNSFEVVAVPVGADGLDLEMLRSSGSTVAYVTPSHQLPTGCVMPVANRLKLIEWTAPGNWIIEDDYDSELRYHGKPIPSLQGLRPQGNIIYLGTFSKILSPALRLSYLVLPRALLAGYRAAFQDYFCSVSLLEQRTMARFMEEGHWERHVRRMRIVYQKKHDALLRAVAVRFGGAASIVGQGAGLHVVLQLPAGGPAEAEIMRRAAEKRVRLFPFSATWADGAPGPDGGTSILLGFGSMTTDEIERGVEILSGICR